ncbi:hypothetical protein BK129_14945 [Paenibacillus amylolyticus]|uniref:hypothetical protein n=1 Tax=Paenibacillus amylolyticus TaxID=1451 RepID=UPI00096D19BD|nr:hypothetical protein [Paenibacillus amylolyticus]OMF05280.1 hypothetical protein BK129_14945 [Paenibacillus amylolyticus]
MAVIAKRLAKGGATTTLTTVYTAPANTTTLIKAVSICNTTAANVEFNMNLADTSVIWKHVVKPYDTITLPFMDQIIQAGETIRLSTSTSTTGGLTYYISGKEVT